MAKSTNSEPYIHDSSDDVVLGFLVEASSARRSGDAHRECSHLDLIFDMVRHVRHFELRPLESRQVVFAERPITSEEVQLGSSKTSGLEKYDRATL